jgi:hypothetical protein
MFELLEDETGGCVVQSPLPAGTDPVHERRWQD